MLRSDKKYSVYDLRQLKGQRCLIHVHVKSPEEAAAAEAAGIDLLSCSFDSAAAQARLPLLVAAAPKSFISGATPHGMASPEEAIRTGFRALELGASSVYCSASPWMIEAMAREGIPVVGHLGMVPRHATWTNVRAIGRTAAEARQLFEQMKRLENAGAYAAELELVPHQLASYLCRRTSLFLMSLGSGNGCDSQFLFSDDILADYDERIPRHAKAYRNFLKEYERLQQERIAAFKEYAADVKNGTFPETRNLVAIDEVEFKKAVAAIEGNQRNPRMSFNRSQQRKRREESLLSPFPSVRIRARRLRIPASVACARQIFAAAFTSLWLAIVVDSSAADPTVRISAPMPPPQWAVLERRLLAENVPACREFFKRYFDERGYLQCFVRWGANDGPDDAFENFNGWPELHALGASDEILTMYLAGWEGMLKQYTAAKTVDVPIARDGMYYKDFCVQADWMHLGEGLQLFNRMGLSVPTDSKYQARARRFAGFYMNEDPEAQNYDPRHRIIRSMLNGSKGPMLRPATALDWVGDPFDVTGFVALHGEHTFEQFLAHYQEYTDVVGDNCLNLVATTLPSNAYLLAHEKKYRHWILEYMDAWVERMKQNHWIIPSYVDLNGKVGGPEGKWWGNTYGWGFSPINPVNGRRENRHRIPRALVGFNNALWVSGDQKYVDAWRNMIIAVNAHARTNSGRVEYPTMHGAQGWYGWQSRPWDIGALEVYYWSMKPGDLKRVAGHGWMAYLQGQDASYPEAALQRDLRLIGSRTEAMRRDNSPPEKRLADNMLGFNPAATESLVQLMWGGLPPGRDGGLVNARLRYFDPARRRAGVPEDVAALVSQLTERETVVTLVNLNKTEPRTLVMQGGAYGEHQFESVTMGGKTTRINSALLTVQLNPGSGERLTLRMKRYANPPTVLHPWHRTR